MLFMGEEFAAATPFQFFCDFHDELAVAVTEGRRREFAGFAAFIDPAARALIPDPNDPATFLHCKLHWACMELPQHQDCLNYYRHLLTLRRTHIMPLLPGQGGSGEFELLGTAGLIVRWRLNDNAILFMVANFGNEPVSAHLHIAGSAIFISQTDLLEEFASGSMPAWCVAWFISES